MHYLLPGKKVGREAKWVIVWFLEKMLEFMIARVIRELR